MNFRSLFKFIAALVCVLLVFVSLPETVECAKKTSSGSSAPSVATVHEPVIEEVTQKQLERILQEKDYVAVYWYKPECKRCTKVLQELENIDDEADQLDIGFVKIHDEALADEYNLGSLPALVYYRHQIPILYEGELSKEEDVLEWLIENKSTGDDEEVIEDVTAKTLSTLIGNVDNLVVLFYDHGIDDSMTVLEELEKIDDDCDKHGIQFVKIDDDRTSRGYGIDSVPAIVFFEKQVPNIYNGDLLNEEEILHWLVSRLEKDEIEDVTDEMLDRMVKDGSTLAVLFYDNNDDKSQKVLEELENIDDECDSLGITFVKIDNFDEAKEYGIDSVPSLFYFEKGIPTVYEGRLEEEESVLKWLEQQTTSDEIEDITDEMLDLILEKMPYVAVLFYIQVICSIFRCHTENLHEIQTTNIRHAFGLTLGLCFGYFCFGQQAIHIAGLPAVCYIIIRTQNPQIVQRLVMIVSLVYLSLVHLHRAYFDSGTYTLDITGPLMVITQKVTLLTFSIHDGIARNENELTKSQQFHAIRTLPTALEFFSYVLHFQGLMAGPLVFYKDYIEFIEGTHFLKHNNANSALDKSGNKIIVEPSPTKAVVKKVIGSIVCAYIFMNWVTVYPIKRLSEDEFLENTTFWYKMWYMMMSTTTIRFKYYHAWLLADAICNNSGLGFNGYEKDGNPKWDLISNINVISFELATNLRDAINNWNMGTNQWLRMIVYERVPKKYGTALTFGLSALWHGFYAGYYMTFASGALIVTAARTARKLFRHRFQHSEKSRVFYDILTVLTTRVFMGYLTFPFVLLEFKASLRLYLNLFMCLHLVGLLTIYMLPRFIRGERSQSSKVSVSVAPNGTAHNLRVSGSDTKVEGAQTNGMNTQQQQRLHKQKVEKKILQLNQSHNNEQFIDNVPINSNLCDTNINTEHKLENTDNAINMAVGADAASNATADMARNHSLSNNEDYRRECSTDNHHLSMKIRERIDSETRNIEEFIDKTVTGIVELKDDLMRVNQDNDMYSTNATSNGDGMRKRNLSDLTNGKEIETFLRKEINNAVSQVNVLPAVLSNSHAD